FIVALGRFWFLRGHFSGWDWWLSATLSKVTADGAGVAILKAKALLERGMLALYVGDRPRAADVGKESLSLFEAVNDQWGRAAAMVIAGAWEPNQVAQLEEAVALARQVDDAWLTAWCLQWLGQTVGRTMYDSERAEVLGAESLALAQQTGDAWLIGWALMSLGQSGRSAHDVGRADGYFRESLAHYRHMRDRLGMAWALGGLGLAALEQGKYIEARAYEEERLTIETNLGNKRGMIATLRQLSRVALESGDLEQARMLGERSLLLARQTGEVQSIAWSLLPLARLELIWGNAEGAIRLLEECLAYRLEARASGETVDALVMLAWAASGVGAYGRAREHLMEAVNVASDVGYAAGICAAIEAMAGVVAMVGQMDQAAQLMGAAAARRVTSGVGMHPSDRALTAAALTAMHNDLGTDGFETAWRVGGSLTLEDVMEMVQGIEYIERSSS
ncbi:MAG: hypothetical protein AVDCRST_MAG93-394, partial [uncultured Chloroflexia bacterium]